MPRVVMANFFWCDQKKKGQKMPILTLLASWRKKGLFGPPLQTVLSSLEISQFFDMSELCEFQRVQRPLQIL